MGSAPELHPVLVDGTMRVVERSDTWKRGCQAVQMLTLRHDSSDGLMLYGCSRPGGGDSPGCSG